jgi:serine phosphatase RsbU (regulator of sigma subunit)/anti-sigma regulatory factor (Ser/Thr protein kinase)
VTRHPLRDRIVVGLLLAYIAVISSVQIVLGGGLVRWSGYSILVPMVAGALLSFPLTLFLTGLALAGSVVIYGFVIPDLSAGGRLVVILVVALASLVAVLLCRRRLAREERLRRVTISRKRLALLSDASGRLGSSLDVTRTAQELAEVSVREFSDYVSVDLLDATFQEEGEEDLQWKADDPVVMRRAAHASVLEGVPEAVPKLGEVDTYSDSGLPARALITGKPQLVSVKESAELARWFAQDPARVAAIEKYGFHSCLAVPLSARGVTLGVAFFARHIHKAPFDTDDIVLAEEVAARAAVSIDNARRYARERITALTLQQSLLPRRLPKSAAMDGVASRYLPAASRSGVGGDWFDVIPLSGARVALVVGDVVGHGIQAAATMGRLRSAVRTLSDIDLRPDELLTYLDDLVIRLGEEKDSDSYIGATCVYAIYDPVSGACQIARASNPPPALVDPGGGVTFLDIEAGPPLGLGGTPFECTEVVLPKGGMLALYTDGLVQSRETDMEEGIDALRRALARPAASLESLCDDVVQAVLPARPDDDAALLMARTRALGGDQVATWDLAADPALVSYARDEANERLATWGLEEASFVAELVVSELVTNAVRYGAEPIQLRLIRDKVLICEVSDGSSTSPHLRRARAYDEGGRGLFLVAQVSQRWGSRQTAGGKTIWAECSL